MTVQRLGWLAWMVERVGESRKHCEREALDRAGVRITMIAEALSGHTWVAWQASTRFAAEGSLDRAIISLSKRDERTDG